MPPADVFASCRPDTEYIEGFHKASEKVPELVPKFECMMLVNAVLLIPAAVVSCLGCMWGRAARRHVQQSPPQHRQIMQQPVLGAVVAISSPTENMEQPLMLHSPAPPTN